MAKPIVDWPEVSTVPEFIELIKVDSKSYSSSIHVYRETRNTRWSTVPGILRSGRERLLEHERDAIRDLMAVHPDEFSRDETMFDRLVRMQYFQLPTRLLDVTTNPLVTLYFATETVDPKLEAPRDGIVTRTAVPPQRVKYHDADTVSCISNLASLSLPKKNSLLANKKAALSVFI